MRNFYTAKIKSLLTLIKFAKKSKLKRIVLPVQIRASLPFRSICVFFPQMVSTFDLMSLFLAPLNDGTLTLVVLEAKVVSYKKEKSLYWRNKHVLTFDKKVQQ